MPCRAVAQTPQSPTVVFWYPDVRFSKLVAPSKKDCDLACVLLFASLLVRPQGYKEISFFSMAPSCSQANRKHFFKSILISLWIASSIIWASVPGQSENLIVDRACSELNPKDIRAGLGSGASALQADPKPTQILAESTKILKASPSTPVRVIAVVFWIVGPIFGVLWAKGQALSKACSR